MHVKYSKTSNTNNMYEIVSSVLGKTPNFIESIVGGGNSKLFRVEVSGSQVYALKDYLSNSSDAGNRMQKEYSSLEYLFENGVENIPSPVCKNDELGMAIYNWIDGEKIISPEKSDVKELLKFMRTLHELKDKPGSDIICRATESCFSASDVVKQIDLRIERLNIINDNVLSEFLVKHFMPVYEINLAESRKLYDNLHLNFDDEIKKQQSTLTSSDFGFHNALRSKSGIIFLDFEYFGLDDPVKVISDFIWHPAMDLSEDLIHQFVNGALELYGDDQFITSRLKALFPLFGLRWVLIMLNEFIPEKWTRRMHAREKTDNEWTFVKNSQMQKAMKTLVRVNNRYEQIIT